MDQEVQIDKGREKDTLTLMVKEVFDKINEYNEKNPDNQINMMVLSRDRKGGSSFLIGKTDPLIMELYEVAVRDRGFKEFLRNVM